MRGNNFPEIADWPGVYPLQLALVAPFATRHPHT